MIRLLDLLTDRMTCVLRFLSPTPPQQKKKGGLLIFPIIHQKEEMSWFFNHEAVITLPMQHIQF